MAVPITPVRLGDVVRLKKPHPCGTNEWEITKLGMDIGLACVGCGRKVRLERYEFDRRFRGFIRRPGDDEADRPADALGASGGGAGGGTGGDEAGASEGARGGTGGGAG